ncbi:hypothetical protein EW142_08800 [Flagellimonas allohymeniacidonis]|uniref:Peptidase E n=2 Tax=Flagellimonas allohymeniacidonis TaxID=2517819 RepID=A0A4Q8QIY4_9FLAO|nr:hypothetical protein EW142_08800 [Allomuricauda hymeniacidonis]
MKRLQMIRILKSTVLVTLVLGLMSFGFAHKFYVSVTNIQYSEKNNSLQITSRIFIDDLEAVLQERYGVTSNLATNRESTIAETYIEKYFRAKFVLELDGEKVDYQFLGKAYDNDVIICYLELSDVKLDDLNSVAFQNEILTDLFDEQQNIVHFKWNGKKKSFVLFKENNKGMLNL